MSLYDFKIATLAQGVVGLTNIESLSTPVTPPRPFYFPYREMRELASGLMRGLGLPSAEWRWDGTLTQAERNMLRTLCAGASTQVYIRTRTVDSSDAYANFLAVMVWPATVENGEEVDATRRLDFVIRFQSMVVQV